MKEKIGYTLLILSAIGHFTASQISVKLAGGWMDNWYWWYWRIPIYSIQFFVFWIGVRLVVKNKYIQLLASNMIAITATDAIDKFQERYDWTENDTVCTVFTIAYTVAVCLFWLIKRK